MFALQLSKTIHFNPTFFHSFVTRIHSKYPQRRSSRSYTRNSFVQIHQQPAFFARFIRIALSIAESRQKNEHEKSLTSTTLPVRVRTKTSSRPARSRVSARARAHIRSARSSRAPRAYSTYSGTQSSECTSHAGRMSCLYRDRRCCLR